MKARDGREASEIREDGWDEKWQVKGLDSMNAFG